MEALDPRSLSGRGRTGCSNRERLLPSRFRIPIDQPVVQCGHSGIRVWNREMAKSDRPADDDLACAANRPALGDLKAHGAGIRPSPAGSSFSVGTWTSAAANSPGSTRH